MNEEQIIIALRQLKETKPSESWAVFTKTNIMRMRLAPTPSLRQRVASFLMARRLAYSLAALMVAVAGVLGFIKFVAPGDGTASKAAQIAPSSQTASIDASVEAFKATSQNLAQVAKTNPTALPAAVKEVKDAAQKLADAVKKDDKLAKSVALEVNNNRAYLDVTGGEDLKATSDDLYKAIDGQMIAGLEKQTLTDSQKSALDTIKEYYQEGKYSAALENILLIGK